MKKIHRRQKIMENYPACKELTFCVTCHVRFCLQVQKDLPFLHSSDEEQIDYLCRLGSHYVDLSNFIRKYGEQTVSLPGNTHSQQQPIRIAMPYANRSFTKRCSHWFISDCATESLSKHCGHTGMPDS